MRNLLPLKKTYPIAAITNELMQNRPGSSLDHDFKYLDPKVSERQTVVKCFAEELLYLRTLLLVRCHCF